MKIKKLLRINKANQVLNELRKEIINALQQKGVHGEQKDGMDISLLVINTETNECQWAGANNPLWVIDGVIVDSGGIGYLNQSDIESIEVLKDAASTAIYGAKGADGVLLIETHRGRMGKVQFVRRGSKYLF